MKRKYEPTFDVMRYLDRWRMPDTPQGIELTSQWAESVSDGWFCQAFALPAVYEDIQGVMVIRSTRASKDVYHLNIRRIQRGGRVERPHWYHYTVTWLPHKTLMNWKGTPDAHCKKHDRDLGLLCRVLDCMATNWHESYANVSDREHLPQLRSVFQIALGIPNWVEHSIARSWLVLLHCMFTSTSYRMLGTTPRIRAGSF